MSHKLYKITNTRPNVYINQLRQAVNGFQVTVQLIEFDELHLVDVPNLEPTTVSKAVEKLLDNRQGLQNLGE